MVWSSLSVSLFVLLKTNLCLILMAENVLVTLPNVSWESIGCLNWNHPRKLYSLNIVKLCSRLSYTRVLIVHSGQLQYRVVELPTDWSIIELMECFTCMLLQEASSHQVSVELHGSLWDSVGKCSKIDTQIQNMYQCNYDGMQWILSINLPYLNCNQWPTSLSNDV